MAWCAIRLEPWRVAAERTPQEIESIGTHPTYLSLPFPTRSQCWDIINCNDPAIQDDPRLEDVNIDSVIDNAVAQIRAIAPGYIGGDLYITQGFDFNYEYSEGEKNGNGARGSRRIPRNAGTRADPASAPPAPSIRTTDSQDAAAQPTMW